MSSNVINVKQIGSYPAVVSVSFSDLVLLQQGGLGGPYASISPTDLVSAALGVVTVPLLQAGVVNASTVASTSVSSSSVTASSITVNGVAVATAADINAAIADIAEGVTSFNQRTGDIFLEEGDVLRAGGAPIRDAHFGGWITAPSVWDTRQSDDTVATTNWVQRAICENLEDLLQLQVVTSFNGRYGAVTLQTSDVNAAYAVPGPPYPTSVNPVLGDSSNRIATTSFVDESLSDYAPINSPAFTGIPTAPTAALGTSTAQLATTAFVEAAVTAQQPLPLVNVKNYGAVGNASYAGNAGSVLTNVTANGTNVLAVGSIVGTPLVGQHIASINWHSLGAAAIPMPTTVTAVSGTNVTVSQNIPAATGLNLSTWWPINSTNVTGADDTSAIKSAIDYALQSNLPDVYLPPGTYKISDTLQLGYGNGPYTVHLIGSDRAPFDIGFAGASIISVAADRPAINVQGGRLTLIKGIQLLGPNANYALWAQTNSNTLSSDPLDWLDPLLYATGSTPGGLQQHTPLAGITIDAFSGTPPAAPYVQAVPPWTGLGGTYGRATSSDTTISEVFVQGFGVNIAVGLNTASQGDYLRVMGGMSAQAPYGVCVGNTQSRNVVLRNHNFLGLNTFLDNTNMGMQSGLLIGSIDNCSGSCLYRFFTINTSASTPVRVSNCYAETAVRIGTFSAPGAVSGSVEFDSCYFYLPETIHGKIPSGYMTSSGNLGISFRNCMIYGNFRINALVVGGGNGSLEVVNCSFENMATSGPGGSTALQLAINYSGGMIPGVPRFNTSSSDLTRYFGNTMPYYSTPSSSAAARQHGDELNFTGLQRIWMTPVAKNFVDDANRRWTFQKPLDWQLDLTIAGSQVTVAPAWSADTMTFTLASSYYSIPAAKMQVGWILYHINSGTIFVVTAVGAPVGGNYPITTQQQNNLIVNPSTGAYISNMLPDAAPGFVNPLSGITIVAVTTRVAPHEVFYGTFTAVNANITAVHRGDGYGGTLAQYVNAGDQIWSIQYNDSANPSWPIASGGNTLTVSTVTAGSPGSIVLSGPVDYAGRFPIYPVCIR